MNVSGVWDAAFGCVMGLLHTRRLRCVCAETHHSNVLPLLILVHQIHSVSHILPAPATELHEHGARETGTRVVSTKLRKGSG